MRLFSSSPAARTIPWPFTRPSASTAYERAARQWDDGGRREPTGIAPHYAVRLRNWVSSPGALREGTSERLQAYAKAVAMSLSIWTEDWYERALNERSECLKCGQPWRNENLALCTHCPAVFAPCCQRHYHIVKARNGNPECPVCHAGELVG